MHLVGFITCITRTTSSWKVIALTKFFTVVLLHYFNLTLLTADNLGADPVCVEIVGYTCKYSHTLLLGRDMKGELLKNKSKGTLLKTTFSVI